MSTRVLLVEDDEQNRYLSFVASVRAYIDEGAGDD